MNWIILCPTINVCQWTTERNFSAWSCSMVQRKRTEPAIMFKIKRIRVHLGGKFLYSHAFVKISALGSSFNHASLTLHLCISEHKIFHLFKIVQSIFLCLNVKPNSSIKGWVPCSWICTPQPTSLAYILWTSKFEFQIKH